MKIDRVVYLSAFMIILSTLSGCAPKPILPSASAEPAATDTPTQPSVEPLVTVTEALATATSSVPETTATLQTVVLPAPVAEVGATYSYVDGSILVAVPAGEFIMGNTIGTDNPEHKVSLSDFWIYRTEVTNQMFARCVALGKCTDPDYKLNLAYSDPLRINEPVTGLRWDQAEAYCTFVHGRLPTEAEWEKTARGPDGNMFPWGKDNPSCTLANIGRCKPSTTPVNLYPQGQSHYEALDMAGNVFEWVADWYSANYYGTAPTADPTGAETGIYRSVRSSAHDSDSFLAESARRFKERPATARDDLGFRCVVEEPVYFAPWCTQVNYVGGDASGSTGDVSIPVADCPTVSVGTGGYCGTNNNPLANVTFGPNPLPLGAVTTLPGGPGSCSGGPNLFLCTASGSASIKALCTVPSAPVPPGCAADYTLDAGTNTCVYSGGDTGATECLPGSTYDPLTQCCTSTPGTATSYALCPVDQPYPAGGSCWAWPISNYGPLQSIVVSVGTCGHGGDVTPGGGSCSQYTSSNSCPLNICRWTGQSCVPIVP